MINVHKSDQNLQQLYFVHGQEYLLVQKYIDQIISLAKEKMFPEIINFDISSNFNWEIVLSELKSYSLFSNNKIVKLNLHRGKIGVNGAKHLLKIANKIPENFIIIFYSFDLESSVLSSKWLKELVNLATYKNFKKLDFEKVFKITENKLLELGFADARKLAEIISYNTQGNLLATDQEIKKIYMAYPNGIVNLESYKEYITEQSKYSIFNLIDSSFLGKSSQVIKIFKTLSDDSSFPVILSSSLYRELNNLISMSIDMRMGKSLEEIYQSHGVWSYKKNIIKTALLKHSFQHLQKFLMRLSRVDRAIKGRDNTPVLEELESILLGLSGVKNVS